MRQLTLQFDGYADSRPAIDVGTTRQCHSESPSSGVVPMPGTVGSNAWHHWFRCLALTVPMPGTAVADAWRRLLPFSPVQFLQASLLCAFGFVMFFFAAIIGG